MPTLRLLRLLRRKVAPTGRPVGVGHGGGGGPARLALDGVLDLHDLGAQPGEQLGGERERLHLLGGEDAHPVERPLRRGGAGVGDVSEAHGPCSLTEPQIRQPTRRRPPQIPCPILAVVRSPRFRGRGRVARKLTRASGLARWAFLTLRQIRSRHAPPGPHVPAASRLHHGGTMRGIIGCGTYVPYWRLQRSAIGAAMGGYGGPGTRSVASYDEDTTTMAVEAGRLAIRSLGGPGSVAVAQPALRHRRPGLPREDQRHRHPRRPAPRPRLPRPRRRRRHPLRHRRPRAGPRRRRHHPRRHLRHPHRAAHQRRRERRGRRRRRPARGRRRRSRTP